MRRALLIGVGLAAALYGAQVVAAMRRLSVGGELGTGDEGGEGSGILDNAASGLYELEGAFFGSKRLSEQGLEALKREEGLELQTYLDEAGKPTIGYGHLLHAGEDYSQGITEAQADELLRADVASAERAVNAVVSQVIDQSEFDALVSFTFNVGEKNLRSSTLLKKLNAGDHAGAAAEFARWDKVHAPDGTVRAVSALSRRRRREAEMFAQGDYSGAAA